MSSLGFDSTVLCSPCNLEQSMMASLVDFALSNQFRFEAETWVVIWQPSVQWRRRPTVLRVLERQVGTYS